MQELDNIRLICVVTDYTYTDRIFFENFFQEVFF